MMTSAPGVMRRSLRTASDLSIVPFLTRASSICGLLACESAVDEFLEHVHLQPYFLGSEDLDEGILAEILANWENCASPVFVGRLGRQSGDGLEGRPTQGDRPSTSVTA